MRLGQTWEVAAWEIAHLGSCHLGKYPCEVTTWGKSCGKVPKFECITLIIKNNLENDSLSSASSLPRERTKPKPKPEPEPDTSPKPGNGVGSPTSNGVGSLGSNGTSSITSPKNTVKSKTCSIF